MALKPSKLELAEEREKLAKEVEERRKEAFIVKWTHAPSEERAKILWETFSQTDHGHPLPVELMKF
jgi:hypothetical protein